MIVETLMIQKLKAKWGIESTRRVLLILLIFSLTGIGILLIKNPVFHLLGVNPEASLWLKIPVAVLVYQVLLLIVGALFGEFRFFWEKEKRLGRLLMRPFLRS